MSITPAAALARLKVQYPDWKITKAADQYTATNRDTGRRLRAHTIAGLEYLLAGKKPGPRRPR